MIHDFFTRSSSKWDLSDFCHNFLTTAPESEQTLAALACAWTHSLRAIRHEAKDKESKKARKAQLLRKQWDQDPDQKKEARAAVEAFKTRAGTVNHSTFLGEVGTVFSGSVGVVDMQGGRKINESSNSEKRSPSPSSSSEDEAKSRKKKKKKKNPKTASTNPWRQRFLDTFQSMDSTKKMRLSTGTVVEDVIFSNALELGKQTPIHDFVIDADNLAVKIWFSGPDWSEILAMLDARRKAQREVETPTCLQWVPDSVATTLKLREILYGPDQPQGADEEWIADVYRQFLFLLEHPDKPLTRDQCENWFEVTLLGRLVNRCIMTLPSVEVCCKESMSVATRSHLNQGRAQTGDGNYLLPSPRLDAIFRLIQPAYEFGGCEVGKYDRGPEDTKRIDDFNKLAATLSHMLRRLHFEISIPRPERLEVVGLLCSGLSIQTLRMHSPNGYTCLLLREDVLRIPADQRRIRDVKTLLKAMWRLKKTISDTVDLLWSAGDEAESNEKGGEVEEVEGNVGADVVGEGGDLEPPIPV